MGRNITGRLEALAPDTFSIDEVDLHTTVTVPYSEVARVRKNYGGKGFGSSRVDPKGILNIGAFFVRALLTIVSVLV
jgi:hypothetical protein